MEISRNKCYIIHSTDGEPTSLSCTIASRSHKKSELTQTPKLQKTASKSQRDKEETGSRKRGNFERFQFIKILWIHSSKQHIGKGDQNINSLITPVKPVAAAQRATGKNDNSKEAQTPPEGPLESLKLSGGCKTSDSMIALSERTAAKDCAHYFLIAASKLLQDQIQAANSQKLLSPDTERGNKEELEKREREGKKKMCQDMARGGEYPCGDR
ncbi:hypothetical protein EYF80_022506 [Liparis tanakae]|uniref:Uncharacterized protein n=1 Tax=Liparis tanakae TaxID=230148 RepID=A0A4Z2HNB8_9TELE|nr:hypothetical protein EYF80_022506 [Liparis tanakae]